MDLSTPGSARPVIAIQAQALARTALAEGQSLRLRVVSGSMRPLLRPGDELAVAPVTLADLRPGNLVVRAAPDGSFVIHRLLALKDGMLLTRGDSLPGADPPWPADQLAGRVIAAWRAGRPIQMQARWIWVGRLLAGGLLLRRYRSQLVRRIKSSLFR